MTARTLLMCLATVVGGSGCGRAAAPPSESPGPPRIAVLAPMDLELAPFVEQASITERRTVAGQVLPGCNLAVVSGPTFAAVDTTSSATSERS